MEFWLPKKDEELTLSPATKELLERREWGCFLCRLILEDHKANGKLTGYPFESDGKGSFPVNGKVMHIQLEQASSSGDSPPPPVGGGGAKEKRKRRSHGC
jgi:hypothetical protein